MTNYSHIARQGRLRALTLLQERKQGTAQSAPLERPRAVCRANPTPTLAHVALRFAKAVAS